jgi:hypothetical protein
VIVTLMMSPESLTTQDVGRGDTRMHCKRCAGVGNVTWLIREFQNRIESIGELFSFPAPTSNYCWRTLPCAHSHG